MSALGNYNPAAVSVVKAFAYSFHAAPTADIVSWGVSGFSSGGTPASLLNTLFNLVVPQSPFTAYANTSSDTAFLTALVDNFTYGTNITAATKAAWVQGLLPALAVASSRGQFVVDNSNALDAYTGTDPNLLALKDGLLARAETAAAFAQSTAGAAWDGKGWAQLNKPLEVIPDPTYTLTSDVSAADEGTNVTFTLKTTSVAAGTSFDYTLAGTGITAGDLVSGQLSGKITVDANGVGSLLLTFLRDNTTEGPETLRMQLGNNTANNLAHADVIINDTSTTPVQPPTYALTANVSAQDEGATISYTLKTTNLAAGTKVNYTLSGTGITAADITGGSLTGTFTIDAQGQAKVDIGLVADTLTEGAETLRLQLANAVGQLDVTIKDTSITPPPTGTADVQVIADNQTNSNAHAPTTTAEGELGINTYLTYDLLNQSSSTPLRMTIADLKATSPIPGAALNASNHSADRGNIPQVSNQSLNTYDLGLKVDRVDYSAETGKIVAVVSKDAPADTQWVLVNDNGTDNVFNNPTDRIDTLKNIEEVVASAGGGVLDLTGSGQDWNITFSRNFNATTDIAAGDRAVHRIELVDQNSNAAYGRSYIDVRDGGKDANASVATAAWTSVQGSDRNETLSFTDFESGEARVNVLRGGNNAVKFNELTRSILVDVAMTPWIASTNAADDTNSTGRTTLTTSFTIGDGLRLISDNTNVTSSYTPDNAIAPGVMLLAGTQDAEDAISFGGTAQPKIITLGQSIGATDYVNVRLAGSSSPTDALRITGFEFVRDNGTSDDLYIADNIAKATQANPVLTDALADDHDTLRIGTNALGSAAVGGANSAVNLAKINDVFPGFNVDFDVLDISTVAATGLNVTGTSGTDDELVLGKLSTVSAVTLFESLVLTNITAEANSTLTLDLDASQVIAGSTQFTFNGSLISGNGLAFNTTGQASVIPAMTSGMSITVVDSTPGAGATLYGGSGADVFTGGAGNDVLRGGGGNDALNAGVSVGSGANGETWTFTILGTPDALPDTGHRVKITMNIDGKVLTLSEAAAEDTDYSDGDGAVPDGSSSTTIGTAMAALINANLAAINAGPGTGTLASASYSQVDNQVVLRFQAGVDANDVVSFGLFKGSTNDDGSLQLSQGININGGNGGSDTFIFEKSGALNGTDTITNFTPFSDKLDVKAFVGGPVTAANSAINAALGGGLTGVPSTAEFIFNKPQGSLSPNDFATGSEPGKLVLTEGGRSVVVVTQDPTGARGDAANTPVTLYFVENGPLPGLSDLTVSLVGIITGPIELSTSDMYAALS